MGVIGPELEAERKKICKIAEESGLDFFDTIFELVSYKELNAIAAKGGFPTRYPHWKFGMQYEQLSKSYEYGLSKIYELVINTDPCYAYLLEGNEFLDQKLVMAHVYGHCDFFKNNQWFSQTDRKMLDTMANHAVRIRRYIDRYGLDVVESFIDHCLTVENLIDAYSPYKKIKVDVNLDKPDENASFEARKTPDYLEKYMTGSDKKEDEEIVRPKRDVLKFLIENAPLESWQQDVLSIIRDEAYYFAPQAMTKVMNEGWASFWHSKLMTEKIMHDCDIIDFADRHSGAMVMAPGGFNPYKIGIELFRDVKTRWDKGQFGHEWENCDDMMEKKNWDLKSHLGREKIFQVRRDYNDVTFIDEFLSEEFCVKNKMFVYKFNKRTQKYELDTRDFVAIKKKLLFQLTNQGQPIISAIDRNFNGGNGLLLSHLYEGVDMQPDYMQAAMESLYHIWQNPVHLATVMDGEGQIFTYDGQEFSHKSLREHDTPQESDDSKEDKN